MFEKINTEEDAYWLGFLYADGCVHSSPGDYKIELSLKEEDYSHLEKYKKYIGRDNKISYRASSKSYRYNFRDKNTHSNLIKLGCVPAKSLILNFPTKEQVPDELLRHFVRGYFDGDGSFWYENKFGLSILSSKSFLEGLKYRVPKLKNLNIYPVHYERPENGQRIQTGNKQIVN